MQRSLIAVFALIFAALSAHAGERIVADHLTIEWLVPEKFSAVDERVGILFRPEPGWHVYWKNPGDSGAAPKFKLQVSGAEAGPILWPYPTRLPVGPLINLGYEGEVAYLFDLRGIKDATLEIDARLEWLVCKEECIPGFGQLTLQRPVASARAWQSASLTKLEDFSQRVPRTGVESPWRFKSLTTINGALQLVFESQAEKAFEIFPIDGELLPPNAPIFKRRGNEVELSFALTPGVSPRTTTGFVLVSEGRAWEFTHLPMAGGQPVRDAIWLLIVSAFVGGILLNLMPCVFPVLSIKALALVRDSTSPAKRRREGWLYTAGVMTTFLALGVIFLALRKAGGEIGWGFQLQSPVTVLLLAVLFWLMALNFLGVFEFGSGVMGWAGRADSWRSSFGTGVLSVFIAAPCTGPFMGSALGAAAVLPAYKALAIFAGLGAGLAFPMLVFSVSPQAARVLPKPGAWMERLKQFFAFPLFATVLWLLWVLGIQTGSQGWLSASSLMLAISFALWLGRSEKKSARVFAWIFALACLAFTVRGIQTSEAVTVAESIWKNYESDLIQTARRKGQPVFIDFTAAWCITCQVNKKTVLETAAAERIFAKHEVLRVRADWTRQDPVITRALAEFGRNSVPLYVFYGKGADAPEILPQVLTISVIENLFKDQSN